MRLVILMMILMGTMMGNDVMFAESNTSAKMMVQATVEPDQVIMFVRSLKASIYSDATFESDVVTELDRGHELEVLSTDGSWSHVQHGKDESGWIYKMLLSKNMPLAVVDALEGAPDISNSQRVRASIYTSAAAARGLSDSADDLEESVDMDEAAVDSMESFKVDSEDGLKFIMDDSAK